jgi:UDP-GlcNAc3NAcA epimerase
MTHLSSKADRVSRNLEELRLKSKQYVLATIHRAKNMIDTHRLRNRLDGLALLARGIAVVVPLYSRTRGALEQSGLLNNLTDRVCTSPPVGYLDLVMLEETARIIATDSGGVQKEPFFYNVTVREETE